MFDSQNPEGYNTQAESNPEFDAVRGTEGLNVNSNENDDLMKLLKEMGF